MKVIPAWIAQRQRLSKKLTGEYNQQDADTQKENNHNV